MCRRGLTLLEVLIAIGLALAMLAIAIPPLTGALDRRAFESAADSTLQQLLLARAHAQATGRPVEVVYHADRRLIEARRFEPGAGDDLSVAPADDASDDDRTAGDPDERAIPEGWATYRLPTLLRLADQPPESSLDDDDAAFDATFDAPPDAAAPSPAANSDDALGSTRLTVFMPDGSALLGRDMYLADDAGRVATIAVNPWTGLPTVTIGAIRQAEPMPESEPEPEDSAAADDDPDWPQDLPDPSEEAFPENDPAIDPDQTDEDESDHEENEP
ncbi:MAG: hypothetical protein ACYTGP_09060 [Planctomycetota bacterium]